MNRKRQKQSFQLATKPIATMRDSFRDTLVASLRILRRRATIMGLGLEIVHPDRIALDSEPRMGNKIIRTSMLNMKPHAPVIRLCRPDNTEQKQAKMLLLSYMLRRW